MDGYKPRKLTLEELQTSKKLLERALELLDHGKKWTKYMYGSRYTRMCSISALYEAQSEFSSTITPWGRAYRGAKDFLMDCIKETYGYIDIIEFNDHYRTEWRDVKKMFICAIRKADKAIKS